MTAAQALNAAPGEHTMGASLRDYVLPKVPTHLIDNGVRRAQVYPNRSLSILLDAGKRTKRFNWRRPFFTKADDTLHCVVPPGRDYAHHYQRLIETACALNELDIDVQVEYPQRAMSLEFIDYWLPASAPRTDCVLLGYVEQLFTHQPGQWHHRGGFGWRHVTVGNSRVLLLGCEFSYWGDLARALVDVLAREKATRHVIYVGKLGSLRDGIVPNRAVATGTTSTVDGTTVSWPTQLRCDDHPDVYTQQRHITQPSVIDETTEWLAEHQHRVDLVDPEIGHMAMAANRAGIAFDYLHVVTDNLTGSYEHGLHHERRPAITRDRQRCLARIESILNRSLS